MRTLTVPLACVVVALAAVFLFGPFGGPSGVTTAMLPPVVTIPPLAPPGPAPADFFPGVE